MAHRKSTTHLDMADNTAEPYYQNIENRQHALARDISECTRSSDDLSRFSTTTSDVTITEDSQCSLSRCRSLDDYLKDNGVVFEEKRIRSVVQSNGQRFSTNVCQPSINVRPGSRKLHTAAQSVKVPETADSDDDDNGTSCNYENLPAALYAQVSPPKPHQVYGTPQHLKANPLWESTPMSETHKPRIRNLSGPSDVSNSHVESSLRMQIRKKMGMLLDDKAAAITPYKSAFRPYNKETCAPTPSNMQKKLQDHSIAELRRTNGQILNSHYLCMSRNKSVSDQSPASVMASDITVRPASLGQSITFNQDTVSDSITENDSSPDSGRGSSGNSNQSSPPQMTQSHDETIHLSTFGNLKDSCIVHQDNMQKNGVINDYTLRDTDSDDSEDTNVYETIPNDSTTVRHLDYLTDTTCQSTEHVYCKIGDIPTILENAVSINIPEPPPINGRSTLLPGAINISTEQKLNAKRQSGKILCDALVNETDIVETDQFHTYTVADVMHSFQQYAGHLDYDTNHRSSRSEIEQKGNQPQQVSAAQQPAVVSSTVTAIELLQKHNQSKRNSKYNISKFFSKYRKQSQTNTKSNVSEEQSSKPNSTAESTNHYQQSKNTTCDFTPGFSRVPPFGTTGPLYSGRGAKLVAIKKTLSFQDLSPGSTRSERNSNRTSYCRQKSEPSDTSRLVTNNYTRQPNTGIRHIRFASDFTPTVIDGRQSYHSTPTDVTKELIISPPSAFKSATPDGSEEHDYENIQYILTSQKTGEESHTAYRVTPLRRTQSALQLHWDGISGETKEIFC
jgi:hypothetical protein